jgi:DNA polymerase elongation subunit (family B)
MNNLVFCDIETVPEFNPSEAVQLPYQIRNQYLRRYNHAINEAAEMDPRHDGEENPTPIESALISHYKSNAGMYAEFGKIISISIGVMKADKFLVRSYYGDDEKLVLDQFAAICNARPIATMAGHNIKEFDAPWLMRRMLIHRIALPKVLQLMGLKPWESPLIDTMEMWGATAWKYRCGLDLLCEKLGVPSSKKEFSGPDIGKIYYGNHEMPWDKADALKKIAEYNAQDVIADARCYARMKGFDVFTDDQIEVLQPNVFPN